MSGSCGTSRKTTAGARDSRGYRGTCAANCGDVRAFAISLVSLIALAACGDNLDPVEPWILDTVEPADGFWIRTPEFPVASSAEIQDCYFFKVPDVANGADLWIDHTTLALNPGSHHMNVFRVKTIVNLDPASGLAGRHGQRARHGDPRRRQPRVLEVGELGRLAARRELAAVGAREAGRSTGSCPQGVAARFHPGEMLMLQIHYVNATDQVTPWVGRGGINFYRSKDSDTIELGTLFATQQNIRVCESNPTPHYSGACALPPGTHTVVGANGHFHSRGTRFQMWAWDGTSTVKPDDSQRFYDNTNWNEPVMETGMDVAAARDRRRVVAVRLPVEPARSRLRCGQRRRQARRERLLLHVRPEGRDQRALQRVRLLLPEGRRRRVVLLRARIVPRRTRRLPGTDA